MAAVTRTPTAYLVTAELAHALTTEARSAWIINAPRQVNVRLGDATGNGKKCLPKVANCGGCNENTDCLSGNCRAGTCADNEGQICDNQRCTSATQCASGRCDKAGNGKRCLSKLDDGGRCNEKSDCKSNRCKK